MSFDLLGWSHLALAIAGIVFGGVVALMRKGTPRHRLVGRLYAFSMLGVCGTAFLIYDLLGRFGPFHIAAILSSITVIAGWIPARRKKPRRWVEHHAMWMSWSYVGLLAAFAAETLSRVPDSPFWWMVAGASLGVVAIGYAVIRRTLPRILRPYRMQAEHRAAESEAA